MPTLTIFIQRGIGSPGCSSLETATNQEEVTVTIAEENPNDSTNKLLGWPKSSFRFF